MQLQPAPFAGDTPAEPTGDAPTRAFAGFRTERRIPPPPPARRRRPNLSKCPRPATARPQWDSGPTTGPVTGIPRVDPTAYGAYYPGTPDAPGTRAAPVPPGAVPQTPYPELSTSVLLRPVKPPPSEGWRRALYVMSGQLINLGEGPRATTAQQPGRPGQPAAARLLPDRGAVVEGRGRQDHDHRSPGRHLRLGARRPGDRGGRQSRPRHAEPEGSARDAGDRTASAARRRQHRPLQRRPQLHLAGRGRAGSAGLGERSGRVARRSAPTTTPAPWTVLERFYGLVLTDCGTGLLHSAMSAVLAKADMLIVVSLGLHRRRPQCLGDAGLAGCARP